MTATGGAAADMPVRATRVAQAPPSTINTTAANRRFIAILRFSPCGDRSQRHPFHPARTESLAGARPFHSPAFENAGTPSLARDVLWGHTNKNIDRPICQGCGRGIGEYGSG